MLGSRATARVAVARPYIHNSIVLLGLTSLSNAHYSLHNRGKTLRNKKSGTPTGVPDFLFRCRTNLFTSTLKTKLPDRAVQPVDGGTVIDLFTGLNQEGC
jgi:hypothetical protein